MAGFEMDPVFCKALKLLHSSAKDSADQIMHLLEEVIEQKYGGTKTLNLKCGSLLFEEPPKATAERSAKPSRGSSPVQGAPQPAGQASEKSSRDSTPLSEPVSARTSPDADDGDLALEIFEDDLNCTVCKGMSVGARNRLVECSDCHLLYHQECHKPPISENDVNDPRLVWYCSDCVKKNQEKVQTKAKALHSESSHKKAKSESSSDKPSMFKKSSSSSSSAKSSAIGLGHLAAALQAPKSSSSSSSSGSSSSSSTATKHHSGSGSGNSSGGGSGSGSGGGAGGGGGGKASTSLNYSKNPGSPNPKSQSTSVSAPANIIAADKRLQNMKKKAAAKMQEKRSKHK